MEWNKEKKIDLKYIFTIPNILSYLRLLLIPPFMSSFLKGRYVVSAVLILFSGISDCLDGFLARKLNQITQLGKLIDPVADKLTLIAVAVCLSIIEPMIFPVVAILATKDILMLIGATLLLKKHILPVAAAWYGKVGTVCFYISVAAIVVFDIWLKVENFAVVSFIMLSVTALVMIYSLIRYYFIFKALLAQAKEEEAGE